MKNEKTSKRVASIAARILRLPARHMGDNVTWRKDTKTFVHFNWSQIRALAASALTQAPDKKKTKRR